MILAAALGTVGGQLAAGHGHERAGGAFDDLQVADHERIVERDRAERLEPFSRLLHELDANLGDFHGCSPCVCGQGQMRNVPTSFNGDVLHPNGSFARQTRRQPLCL